VNLKAHDNDYKIDITEFEFRSTTGTDMHSGSVIFQEKKLMLKD